jgi:cysteinyl-tRNA synthetase
LGLAQVAPEEFLKLRSSVNAAEVGLSAAEIEQAIAARIAARKAKNWAESDRIRDELVKAGVVLEDKPGGTTTWRRA